MKATKLTLIGIVLVSITNALGQNPRNDFEICTDRPANKGKYRLIMYESAKKTGRTLFQLEIPVSYRSEANYKKIAKEFRERYCKETQIGIFFYASRHDMNQMPPIDPKRSMLAHYVYDPEKNEEVIILYAVNDGKIEWRYLYGF